MNEARRRAYLEAMGFDVWLARPAEPDRNRLVIGPGQGSTLLVCESPGNCAGKLAGDIGRAIGAGQVWAWPDPDGGGVALAEAVEQHLFTRVIVFGPALAWSIFNGEAPAVLGSSAICVAASLDDLAGKGSARRELWGLIRSTPAPG